MMMSRFPCVASSWATRKLLGRCNFTTSTSSSWSSSAAAIHTVPRSSRRERSETAEGTSRLVGDRIVHNRSPQRGVICHFHTGAAATAPRKLLTRTTGGGPTPLQEPHTQLSRSLWLSDTARSRIDHYWKPRRFFSGEPAEAEDEEASSAAGVTGGDDSSPEVVPIVYVEADGTEKSVMAPVGMNLMEVAHANHVELEGACGGELACSTCHLIFPQDVYDTLPPMEEDEVDMLDLAFEVTDTSRLGCQIKVRKDMAGMKVRIPDDGF